MGLDRALWPRGRRAECEGCAVRTACEALVRESQPSLCEAVVEALRMGPKTARKRTRQAGPDRRSTYVDTRQ
jgi:hypothetical protein